MSFAFTRGNDYVVVRDAEYEYGVALRENWWVYHPPIRPDHFFLMALYDFSLRRQAGKACKELEGVPASVVDVLVAHVERVDPMNNIELPVVWRS